MKSLLKLFLVLLLLSSMENLKAGVSMTVRPDTSIAPNYGDLNTFWTDFKKYVLTNNKEKLADMSAFKFMNQNNMIDKADFLNDFSFARAMRAIRKVGLPKYTKDKHSDYDTGKYLGHTYTAIVADMALYFCKIKGTWKFTGISYGE